MQKEKTTQRATPLMVNIVVFDLQQLVNENLEHNFHKNLFGECGFLVFDPQSFKCDVMPYAMATAKFFLKWGSTDGFLLSRQIVVDAFKQHYPDDSKLKADIEEFYGIEIEKIKEPTEAIVKYQDRRENYQLRCIIEDETEPTADQLAIYDGNVIAWAEAAVERKNNGNLGEAVELKEMVEFALKKHHPHNEELHQRCDELLKDITSIEEFKETAVDLAKSVKKANLKN